jgi:hypothetical protein
MTVSTFLLIAGLLTPAWFSAIRLFQLFFRGKLGSRAIVWFYALSFVWIVGGVLFLSAITIPSGIPYGFVLLNAAMIADGLSSDKTGAKQ